MQRIFGPQGRHNFCRGCKAPEMCPHRARSPDRGDTEDEHNAVSPLSGLRRNPSLRPGPHGPGKGCVSPFGLIQQGTAR